MHRLGQQNFIWKIVEQIGKNENKIKKKSLTGCSAQYEREEKIIMFEWLMVIHLEVLFLTGNIQTQCTFKIIKLIKILSIALSKYVRIATHQRLVNKQCPLDGALRCLLLCYNCSGLKLIGT